MDATSMPKVSWLVSSIIGDSPDITFSLGDDFSWSPEQNTVRHPKLTDLDDIFQLLHEVAHAKLGHQQYQSDIELIDMERQAWELACQLGFNYELRLQMTDDIVQNSLDSYRLWLHSRSVCPSCQAVGVEQSPRHYSCLICHQAWTVNEARTCQLRRLKV